MFQRFLFSSARICKSRGSGGLKSYRVKGRIGGEKSKKARKIKGLEQKLEGYRFSEKKEGYGKKGLVKVHKMIQKHYYYIINNSLSNPLLL